MTDPACRFRRYRPEDKNGVWQVHDRAFRNSPVDFLPEYNRELRHIEEAYLGTGGEFLVGLVGSESSHDETIVACGGYLPTTAEGATHGADSPAAGEARTVELRSIRVDPDHQRRGIGRGLVHELEARATSGGFERVLVETVEALSGAVGLYRSLDYEIRSRSEEDERTTVTLGRSLPRTG